MKIGPRTTAICLGVFLSGTVAAMPATFRNRAVPVIQSLRTTVRTSLSNFDHYETNFGTLFYNAAAQSAGAFWPRGSGFTYLYGGGLWFGAVLNGQRTVEVSYNPFDVSSWFQPGSAALAKNFHDLTGVYPGDNDVQYSTLFPVFRSTDYDRTTGYPLHPSSSTPRWPIWDTDPDVNARVGRNHYFGTYVDDPAKRDTAYYPLRTVQQITSRFDTLHNHVVLDTTYYTRGGPVFVSEEDLFSVYNDLDTSRYTQRSPGRQRPLGIEVQQTVYSWGSTQSQDIVFIVYRVVNRAERVLDSCWIAPVFDPDIGSGSNDCNGYYTADTSLHLAIHWSDRETNVPGAHVALAYPAVIGVDLVESPAVYRTGEVADSLVGMIKAGFHPSAEQLGVVRSRCWDAKSEKLSDDARYAFMSGAGHDTIPVTPVYSDKRLLLSSGPMRLPAGASAQIVVALMIARDSISGDTSYSSSMNACVALDARAQNLYDTEYRVTNPTFPPDPPTFRSVLPGDHRVSIHWDSAAEFSHDVFVGGFDFLGYRLYRGRVDRRDQYEMIKQWSLNDLDSSAFAALRRAIPSDSAPPAARAGFYAAVHRTMDSLTHHYTYVDSGNASTLLYNNVPYYYWIAAFDEGDVLRGIPSQETGAVDSLNKVMVTPKGTAMSSDTLYSLTMRTGALNGVHNFAWLVQNQAIVNQLLTGDTVDATFATRHSTSNRLSWYNLTYLVHDTRGLIADISYSCKGTLFPLHTPSNDPGNNSFFLVDPPFVHSHIGDEGAAGLAIPARGAISSGNPEFMPNQVVLGALTSSFDYSMYTVVGNEVFPDSVLLVDTIYRKHLATGIYDTVHTTRKAKAITLRWVLQKYGLNASRLLRYQVASPPDIVRSVVGTDSVTSLIAQLRWDSLRVGADPYRVVSGPDTVPMYCDGGSLFPFDSESEIGPYTFVVHFLPGGAETRVVGGVSYEVPYLNVAVDGEQIYTVPDAQGNDSTIRITYPLGPVDTVQPGMLPAGHWTLDPTVWHFTPSSNTDAKRQQQYVGPAFSATSTANRYYLTTPRDPAGNYLVFVNRLRVGGFTIMFDSANKTLTPSKHDSFPGQFLTPATHDMRPGDAVRIQYMGGVLGLPTPGATASTLFNRIAAVQIPRKAPSDPGIVVDAWPNPVYGRREKLALSNLPERCAIELCTITGECIARISHREGSQETIDLAAAGVARRGTQLLVARIVTPDGASRAVKVVVLGDGR